MLKEFLKNVVVAKIYDKYVFQIVDKNDTVN